MSAHSSLASPPPASAAAAVASGQSRVFPNHDAGKNSPPHDATASLKTAPDNRLLQREVERRVQDRTAQLQEALKELETFSYSVSHDLRAPLRGIAGFARTLVEEHSMQLDPEGRRLLSVIRAEAQRMGQLIEDILTFSKIGRQEVDADDIDMTELARSAFQNLAEAMPSPLSVHLDLQPLPTAFGDRSMMRQVFANLLGNAIKFSSRRPDPRIEVSGWSEPDRNVYRVTDNGVGFDPLYADKLFGVFQRLHSQHEFEGTGVGLAMVQRVIQRHGGVVWAEGRPDAGASFFFALPPRREAATDGAA